MNNYLPDIRSLAIVIKTFFHLLKALKNALAELDLPRSDFREELCVELIFLLRDEAIDNEPVESEILGDDMDEVPDGALLWLGDRGNHATLLLIERCQFVGSMSTDG